MCRVSLKARGEDHTLTVLALWPKGDCWHGGGLFLDDTHVQLNHKRDVAAPHPEHQPQGIHVKLRENVHGEDEPLYADRLERDGWKLQARWDVENLGYPEMFRTRQPAVRVKNGPDGCLAIQLTRSISGLDYGEEFALLSKDKGLVLPLDESELGRLGPAGTASVWGLSSNGTENLHKEPVGWLCNKPRFVGKQEW